MAHHASALKQMRQGVKRTGPQPREPVPAQDPGEEAARRHRQGRRREAARSTLAETVERDRQAAKKGVVHDNAAARYKSRLTRRVNALAAPRA